MIHSRTDKAFDWTVNAILFVMLLVALYPLYYTVIASISAPMATAKGSVTLLPVGFTLDSYKQVFAYKQIWVGYANTIFYTVFGTLVNLALTIPAAYGLSKRHLPGRSGVTMIFLFTMYFSGGLVPSYLMIKNLSLLNTRWVLIVCNGISIYNLIVTRVYFSNSIPEEIYEASRIDGTNDFQAFWKIALPLAVPILAVMALFYSVSHWNSYFSAMLYITKPALDPLQIVLRKVLILNENALNEEVMQSSLGPGELLDRAKRAYAAYSMKYSMVFIASAPLLIVYPFVQKYFIRGIMIGSLKG
ncbi:sugar ABC transporter permease [Clostridia bacterium]|nr:sugar ABC transporter permease [Clostridia bacterium]